MKSFILTITFICLLAGGLRAQDSTSETALPFQKGYIDLSSMDGYYVGNHSGDEYIIGISQDSQRPCLAVIVYRDGSMWSSYAFPKKESDKIIKIDTDAAIFTLSHVKGNKFESNMNGVDFYKMGNNLNEGENNRGDAYEHFYAENGNITFEQAFYTDKVKK